MKITLTEEAFWKTLRCRLDDMVDDLEKGISEDAVGITVDNGKGSKVVLDIYISFEQESEA